MTVDYKGQGTKTVPLKEISVKRYGDLVELGVVGNGVAVLVELTVEQAAELARLLRAVRKEIVNDP